MSEFDVNGFIAAGIKKVVDEYVVELERALPNTLRKQQERIAELEAERKRLFEDKSRLMDCYFEFETIAPDGDLKISVLDLYNELVETREKAKRAEAMVERLIEVGEVMKQACEDQWGWEDMFTDSEFTDFDDLVAEWKEQQ